MEKTLAVNEHISLLCQESLCVCEDCLDPASVQFDKICTSGQRVQFQAFCVFTVLSSPPVSLCPQVHS